MREERIFTGAFGDRDNYLIKKLGGSFDQRYVTVGNRVKGTGIYSTSFSVSLGHKLSVSNLAGCWNVRQQAFFTQVVGLFHRQAQCHQKPFDGNII
jgi:hypothetical protein